MKKPNELKLYIGSGCPYCHKVLRFMDEHKIDIPVIDVWSDDAEYDQLAKLSGKTQVPCLKMDDGFMLESEDIIKQLKAWFS